MRPFSIWGYQCLDIRRPGETSFVIPALPAGMDPVLVVVAVGLAILIFFLYLLARRTFLGFREGMDRGKR